MYKRKGFTLVELLFVVLLLGILAAIAIPRIAGSTTVAKKNVCKTNVDSINSQIELWKANNDSYPTLLTLFADPNYFPDGTPVCPFGTPYTLNANNRVPFHTDTDHGL
jgi:prepilin-type N-terminal cleavage/methylation domain-containing protein